MLGTACFKNLSTWEYTLTVRTMVYLIPVTLTPPSSCSSSKPPYLSSTCSTTRCHKNNLERPEYVETRKKKNDKLEEKSLMMLSTLSIYSVSKWRQTLEMGLGDVPPPLPFISAWQKIHYLYVFVWSWINKLNSFADTSNVCTVEIGKEAP